MQASPKTPASPRQVMDALSHAALALPRLACLTASSPPPAGEAHESTFTSVTTVPILRDNYKTAGYSTTLNLFT